MNKKIIALSILLTITISILFAVSAMTTQPRLMSSAPQGNQIREISHSLQATDVPIPIPTIVINPPPNSSGFFGLTPLTILVFVLVGAVILIALVAVLRKS